jgi:hypothetical protein
MRRSASFHQALATAWRQQAKSLELRAAMSLARLYQKQGRPAEARPALAGCCGWFTERLDTPDLRNAKALLEEIAWLRGAVPTGAAFATPRDLQEFFRGCRKTRRPERPERALGFAARSHRLPVQFTTSPAWRSVTRSVAPGRTREGVPGTAKTLMARTLARLLALDCKRVQFTPDLIPSDVLGTNVFNLQSSQFEFRPGPVFTDILVADEIDRTPPKTQAALLEVMEEKTVTLDGVRHPLSELFTVVATQNPIECEGTYRLVPQVYFILAPRGFARRQKEAWVRPVIDRNNPNLRVNFPAAGRR